jgi:kumamolisin
VLELGGLVAEDQADPVNILAATKPMMIGVAMFGLVASAQAWSSARHSYPNSIKAIAASGPNATAGRPAIVRPSLTLPERQAQMDFEVALRMRNFAEFQGRVAAGEQVSRGEMDARYFPLQADYDRVVQWVRDQGFTVTRTDANKLAVFARGSVDATAAAFQVSFARVGSRGAEYTSAVTAPSLPAELAPAVLGIHGLQPNIRPHPLVRLRPMVDPVSYLPNQIFKAYGGAGLTETGAGQTIALIEAVNPIASDLTAFWTIAGVPASTANIQYVSIGIGPDTTSSTGYAPELDEASLDTQWATGLAPGAVIRIYGISSSDAGGFDEAYQQIYADLATNPNLHQLSISFGTGEVEMDRDYFLIEAQYMANLAGAGVTVFAASGDGGAQPDPSTGQFNSSADLQVEYPASDPSVTGVGGTTLYLNPDNTRQSEAGWIDSGGGNSVIFPEPAWQGGVQGTENRTGRSVPDVASAADPNTGAVVEVDGVEQQAGGTSWATPTWAAFCALINQERAASGKPPVGFLNPKIYPLQETGAFTDITDGGNTSFPATQGFDMSTGLGAPNLAQLISLLGNQNQTLEITDQLGDQYVLLGQTATFAVATYSTSKSLSYQWQGQASINGPWTDLSNGSAYAGTKTPFLTVLDVTPRLPMRAVQCIVSDGANTVTSEPASIDLGSYGVTTLAGWPGATGTADGVGRTARFDFVGSVRTDGAGNVYAIDAGNGTVRKVTPDGVVTTVAGTPGKKGSLDGPASSALFDNPSGVAVGPDGNLYIADHDNYTVRKVQLPSGAVSTIAGQPGVQGTTDGTGNQAKFYDMENLAADGQGNLYVADGTADTIRKVVLATGAVTTLAGQPLVQGSNDGLGGAATFDNPTGVATDSAGNIYVGDTSNDTIRKITPVGLVSTIAGSPGVPGSSDSGRGTFSGPGGLGVDAQGNIFVGDTFNATVREISAAGIVSTVAGQAGKLENIDGPAEVARFGFPDDIAVGPSGIIYVADGTNNTVRRISLPLPNPVVQAQPVSLTINQGSTVVFYVKAQGAAYYEWLLNEIPVSDGPMSGSGSSDVVSGSTSTQFILSNATLASSGSYQVAVTNLGDTTVYSLPFTLTVVNSPNPGTVASVSTRTLVGPGAKALTESFSVAGATSRTVLVQALGPALGAPPYDVASPLARPALSIHQTQKGRDVVLYTNAGWGSNAALLASAAKLSALPVLQPGSADAELLVTLPPGSYTVEVGSADGVSTGVALCAIYQLP